MVFPEIRLFPKGSLFACVVIHESGVTIINSAFTDVLPVLSEQSVPVINSKKNGIELW